MTTPVGRRHFFISYNNKDTTWATWIAGTLEGAGYSTFIQEWDSRPGENFVQVMQRAMTNGDRTIAVLSPDFLTSSFTAAEWAAAFAQDPTGFNHKLIPVRISHCDLEGLLRQIIYIDLVGADEETARQRLLNGVSDQGPARRAPAFPGAAQSGAGRASFPAATPSPFATGVAASIAGGGARREGPAPSRAAALRDRIYAVLRTDSDFEAFCLDYFPDVKNQFSNGMDRTTKINLLLQQADLDEVATLLASMSRKR